MQVRTTELGDAGDTLRGVSASLDRADRAAVDPGAAGVDMLADALTRFVSASNDAQSGLVTALGTLRTDLTGAVDAFDDADDQLVRALPADGGGH